MWYRIAQNIQAIKNRLTNLGASQEVIDYIVNLPTEDISGHIGLVQKNPSVTVEELKSQYKPKRHFEMPEEYRSLIRRYELYKPYASWAEKQIRKLLHSHSKIDPQMFDIIDLWYVENLELNNRLEISSYNFQTAYELANKWFVEKREKHRSNTYTPLLRDKNGNIIDDRVVYAWDDGWTIQELNNDKDLITEGNKMHNCIAGYWGRVKTGASRVFSLRDPYNKPKATIELNRNNDIVQMETKSGKNIPEKFQKRIDEWYQYYKNKEKYYKSSDFDINQLKDPKIAAEAIKLNPSLFKYINPDLPNYMEIANYAIIYSNGEIIGDLPSTSAYYLDILNMAIKQNGLVLKYVPKHIQLKYKNIIYNAVKQNGEAIQYVDNNMPEYTKIALEAVKQNGLSIKHININTPKYYNIAIEAMRQNPNAFQYIPSTIPKSQYLNLVNLALDAMPYLLQYVDTSLKEYPQIAFNEVKKEPCTIQYIPPNTPEYSKMVLFAVEQNPRNIQLIPTNIPGYSNIAMSLVKRDPTNIRYIPINTPYYFKIALTAIKEMPDVLAYIPTNVSRYQEMVIEAIKLNPKTVMDIFPTDVPDYETIVLDAMRKNKNILRFIIDEDIKPKIILEAIKQKIIQINDIPDEYKSNPEFMKKVKEITNQNVV